MAIFQFEQSLIVIFFASKFYFVILKKEKHKSEGDFYSIDPHVYVKHMGEEDENENEEKSGRQCRANIWFMPVTLNRLMSIIYQAFVFMLIDIDT